MAKIGKDYSYSQNNNNCSTKKRETGIVTKYLRKYKRKNKDIYRCTDTTRSINNCLSPSLSPMATIVRLCAAICISSGVIPTGIVDAI
jgi:hypothetical protein